MYVSMGHVDTRDEVCLCMFSACVTRVFHEGNCSLPTEKCFRVVNRHLDFSFLPGWLCIIFDNDREASEIYLHLSGLLC